MKSDWSDFRRAHAWLRGYSDALLRRHDPNIWPEYRAHYERGHESGQVTRVAVAA